MEERKVMIVSENEESYRGCRELLARRIDPTGILRSNSFEEAKELLRDSPVDFLVMEPRAFLEENIAAAPPRESPARLTGNVREDLDYVRSYVFSHYKERLTLRTLSALISVTPNHLCHVFRQAEGIGIREFVERTRLERAAALLRGTDDPVFAVARKVGFHNDSNFCRKFREYYGPTPKKYRTESRKTEIPGSDA